MRYLHLLLLSSLLLVRAADTGMAGPYTGEWKSDSSGNSGAVHMTLSTAPDGAWKGEFSFTVDGEELKSKVQSFKLENSQLDAACDVQVQGMTGHVKLTGKWDGKAFAGRYQTTIGDTSDPVDAGAWNASRSK
ncbi:MAG TPA: hypothetical protein VNY05_27850 [Candidatus Acidoferrales bacterium]|jgi:hypothetical protein|nr:hypothetical protein [Candidatus Acidoferrales bacterium]